MTYEARHSRPIHYGLADACLLLSILGFAVAGVIPTASGSNPLVGWAIVAACFAAAGVFVLRARDPRPQVRIDANGIHARRYSAETVPWDRIGGAERINAGIQRIIRFPLRDGGRTIGINATFYDRGIDDLVACVRHYRPDLVG